jgi:hypothetical protein
MYKRNVRCTPAQQQARIQAHSAKLERDKQARLELIRLAATALTTAAATPTSTPAPAPPPTTTTKSSTDNSSTSSSTAKVTESPDEKQKVEKSKEKETASLPGKIQTFQQLMQKIKFIQPSDSFRLFSSKMDESKQGWETLTQHFKGQTNFLKQLKQQFDDLKENDDALYVMECGGGGDCLFHVVARALRLSGHPDFGNVSMLDVRNWAAEMLNPENRGPFLLDWNKNKTHLTLEETQKQIRAAGSEYQGETGTLQFLLCHHPLMKKHRIGFMVVSLNPKKNKLIAQYFTDENTEFVMMLYCTGEHWLLAGTPVSPSFVSCFLALVSFPAVLMRLNE